MPSKSYTYPRDQANGVAGLDSSGALLSKNSRVLVPVDQNGYMWFQVRNANGSSGALILGAKKINELGGEVWVQDSAGDTYKLLDTRDKITTQTNVTASRVLGTVYQNTTTKPIFVSVACTNAAAANIYGYSDTTATPTLMVSASSVAASGYGGVGFWVLPNSYYKVVSTGSTLSTWIEWS